MNPELRVLLFTPTGRDTELIATVLRNAHIDCVGCESWLALEKQLVDGAAAVILAEETLEPAGIARLRLFLRSQPAWSDLPFLLLTGRGADSPPFIVQPWKWGTSRCSSAPPACPHF